MGTITSISPSMGQLNTLFKVANNLFGKNEVKTIFEFGSRYGEDTVEFAQRYSAATIYSFECNPKSLPVLKEKIKSYTNIVFNEKAISDCNEIISFYQIDEEKTKTTWSDGNQGASSIFEASGNYPIEEYHQKLINVEAITLHSFMADHNIQDIDILWMDIQGAELKALKGMHTRLKHLKILHLEVEFIKIYKDQPLFKNVDMYLKKHGFHLLGFSSKTHYSGDAIYVNTEYFDPSQIQAAALLLPKPEKSLKYYFSNAFFVVKYIGFRIKKNLQSK